MAKKKELPTPELGLIDPKKPTSIVDIDVSKEVQTFLNKVSKLSNHTISSVVTVLLAVQCINLGPIARAKKIEKAGVLDKCLVEKRFVPKKFTCQEFKKK